MAKLVDFIKYLEERVDRDIYVLGGQAQFVSDGILYTDETCKKIVSENPKEWFKKKEGNANGTRICKLYDKRIEAGITKFGIPDCSGLGMNYLQNISKTVNDDMTANGMYGKCSKIKVSDIKRGDWVFRIYTSGSSKGRAHHIGYVVDDKLNVIESYGRDKGVIKRPFDSSYWNAYGRPIYFKDEIESNTDVSVLFVRNLKLTTPYMSGADVKALQEMLNNANGAEIATDGIFGKKTKQAVKDYQRIKGLTVDGIAGKNTISALGGIWAK